MRGQLRDQLSERQTIEQCYPATCHLGALLAVGHSDNGGIWDLREKMLEVVAGIVAPHINVQECVDRVSAAIDTARISPAMKVAGETTQICPGGQNRIHAGEVLAQPDVLFR